MRRKNLTRGINSTPELDEVMEFYPEFFDEDSQNTKAEGIKQLHKELKSDFIYKKRIYDQAKLNFENFNANRSIFINIFPINIINIILYLPKLIEICWPTLRMLLCIVSFNFIYCFEDILNALMLYLTSNFNINVLQFSLIWYYFKQIKIYIKNIKLTLKIFKLLNNFFFKNIDLKHLNNVHTRIILHMTIKFLVST